MQMAEGRIVERTIAPLTRTTLVRELQELGLEPGMTVIVHSSMRALGWICGGPVTVIQALQDVLTPEGTLIMPAHTANVSDPKEWGDPPIPEGWWETVREEMPPFDPFVTPTYFMGAIAETFRTMPGVYRSNHPRYSFAAWGKHRDQVISYHSLDYGMGEQSPLGEIYQLNGHVLLLGVGYDSNTSMHLGEHQSEAFGSLKKESPLIESGKRVWKSFVDLDYDDEAFPEIGKAFEKRYPMKKQTIGNGLVRLMNQRDVVQFTSTSIRKQYKM